jgi:hypothetical protein
LCANEKRNNNSTDAQRAVADRGTSTARRAIAIGAKEPAERIDDPIGLQIAAVIHERGSRFAWRL